MNGIEGEVSLEDAIGMAGMLVALERAVPPEKWVDWLIERAEVAAFEGLI